MLIYLKTFTAVTSFKFKDKSEVLILSMADELKFKISIFIFDLFARSVKPKANQLNQIESLIHLFS